MKAPVTLSVCDIINDFGTLQNLRESECVRERGRETKEKKKKKENG